MGFGFLKHVNKSQGGKGRDGGANQIQKKNCFFGIERKRVSGAVDIKPVGLTGSKGRAGCQTISGYV